MWAMLVDEYLSDAPTSILRHWRRLGNQGVVEYPMVPFGTVSLAGTEVTSTEHYIYIHTDYIIQTLHIVRSWVYNLNAEEDPDPSWFDRTYDAIYNFLSQLPLNSSDHYRHQRLDMTWGISAPGLRR